MNREHLSDNWYCEIKLIYTEILSKNVWHAHSSVQALVTMSGCGSALFFIHDSAVSLLFSFFSAPQIIALGALNCKGVWGHVVCLARAFDLRAGTWPCGLCLGVPIASSVPHYRQSDIY